MRTYKFKFLIATAMTFLFCGGISYSLKAQQDATIDVKKPEKFENRVLGSDKTATTKFKWPRRITQNAFTHYNFFFNANNKLNEVVATAKQSFKDDYTELLPFYNYTLDVTAAQKIQLDSVLYKCNAAIMLHDLRNDWVDNLYFLMGKAYFYKKQFDSAHIAFQYINYYFQPKKKDELGYKKFVGSNLNDEGNVYSVSTKEKNSVTYKMFNEPPSRNDALVWQARTYTQVGAYSEAAGLLETLKHDPNFPSRLRPFLHEVIAYWYYRNQMWDSSANHLVKALDNAENAMERSRWEYLAAQLYAKTGNKDMANKYYDEAIKHTYDPVMDVYSRLNQIKLAQGTDDQKLIDENVKELMKMAKQDKYANYRNIIYYMAAQMEMLRDNFDAAKGFLQKSTHYDNGDQNQRNRSFLYLGDLAFDRKLYQLAHDSYDSLDMGSPVIRNPDSLAIRKEILSMVVHRQHTIAIEDSLQHIASMAEADRDKYIKDLAKKLRKERGLKEADSTANSNNPMANNAVSDIFAGNDSKGEWYFNNTALKSSGFTEFRKNWGNRPNVDNWRRLADVNAQLKVVAPKPNELQAQAPASNSKTNPTDISYDGLLKNVPLTPQALKTSNDSIQASLFGLGKIFKDRLEDYQQSINSYEDLLKRFPNNSHKEEIYFDLYFCYTKLNQPGRAKFYRDLLASEFSQSKYVSQIDNPKEFEAQQNAAMVAATKNYENIYNLFLEGNFDEAVKQKKIADSIYGKKYWKPQLLYIEAVYYVKQRDDSMAINSLNNLIAIDGGSPMAKKAETMISVLKRRNQIETYLTNLKVERMKEDTVVVFAETPKPPPPTERLKRDDSRLISNQPLAKKDSAKAVIDSSQLKKAPVAKATPSGFTFKPADQHYVAIVLNKVDIVYGNETKNAFNRYNQENYYSQNIETTVLPIDDMHKLVLMSNFSDAGTALGYVDKAKKIAGAQIIPWLAAEKYSFVIISVDNLEVLKNNKDLAAYMKFLIANYPGKFQ